MSSLSDKLRSLGVQIGTDNLKAPAKPGSIPALTDLFDGKWEETASGECFVVKNNIHLGTTHGKVKLSSDVNSTILDNIPGFAGLSSVPVDQYLFIDTETTGLSGGVGSYVFLIGAARFVQNRI